MLIFMFYSIFLLAKAAKLHISRQRYCFFCTYASAMRIFFVKSQISPLFLFSYFLLFPVVYHLSATNLPPISIGISSESHRNLIGISPNDERIFKQLSPKYHLYLQLCLLSSGVPEIIVRANAR